ncbi:MAG TPA: sulfatase-like hydrolase/transferase, partial [Myxococcota bacterium]|nr:sulfatase-like hydrolase/transferase [Myxococcota bacterium]
MLWLWACTPPPKPDMVLITVDTLRADRVGAYGDPLAQTPNIDAFAQQAILFREAVTAAPTTLPAHASLLTGQWPQGHGARDNTLSLTTKQPGLPALLAGAGWATAAFVSASVLAPSTGISAGFSVYDAPSGE